jgi:hypothetical protein
VLFAWDQVILEFVGELQARETLSCLELAEQCKFALPPGHTLRWCSVGELLQRADDALEQLARPLRIRRSTQQDQDRDQDRVRMI